MTEVSSSEISFRLATERDLPVIARLLAEDAPGAQEHRADVALGQAQYAELAALSHRSGAQVLLAVGADGAVLGCLQLKVIAGAARLRAARAGATGDACSAHAGARPVRVGDAARSGRTRGVYEGLGVLAGGLEGG